MVFLRVRSILLDELARPERIWNHDDGDDVGRTRELGRGPVFRPTDEGRLLGHVHLGLRLIEERAPTLDPVVRAELLHAVSCHHDVRSARTALRRSLKA